MGVLPFESPVLATELVACGGGGDDRAGAPIVGPNRVVAADATGAFAVHAASIRALTTDAVDRAAAVEPVTGESIKVTPDASWRGAPSARNQR